MLLVGFVLVAGSLQAQTIIGATTLNGAVTQNQATITVTTATCGQAIALLGNAATCTPAVGNEYLIVDESGFEAGIITAINGSVWTVNRGVGGTQRKAHDSLSLIFVGPTNAFYQGPPGSGSGTFPGAACTRAQLQFLPWFDLSTGLIWSCGSQGAPATASTWVVVNPQPLTLNSTGWLR
jgi:hypothetical protein